MTSTRFCGPAPKATGRSHVKGIRAQTRALILLACLAISAHASKRGVVFQISTDSPQTWIVAVHNVHNLQQALLPHHARIEIIAFGRGLRMLLKTSPVARALLALHQSGVTIDACKKSVLKQGLPPADMSPVVHYIPSGIAEIVRREREGWAYVRP